MSRTYTPRHYTPKIEPRHRGRNDTNASYTAENGVRSADPWTGEDGTYHPGYETADIDVRRMEDGHLRIELYRLAPGTVVVVGDHTITCAAQSGVFSRDTVTHATGRHITTTAPFPCAGCGKEITSGVLIGDDVPPGPRVYCAECAESAQPGA